MAKLGSKRFLFDVQTMLINEQCLELSVFIPSNMYGLSRLKVKRLSSEVLNYYSEKTIKFNNIINNLGQTVGFVKDFSFSV